MALIKATPEKVIEGALSQEGYLEKASNSQLDDPKANAGHGNFTKYARDLDAIPKLFNGMKQGFAWCAVFIVWLFVKVFGVEAAKKLLCLPDNSLAAGCGYAARYYKAKGQFHTSNPKPGDQIFFLDSQGDVAHTGLVYKVDNLYVYTVEGNTSTASGVVGNGGGVWCKRYALTEDSIYGYGRPDYDSVLCDEPEETKEPKTSVKIDVDGRWGVNTTMRLQHIFGTTIDGIVSNQYAIYRDKNPGLVSGWEWEPRPGKNGSLLIKAMQKWAGVPVSSQDGYIGPNTILAFQRKLGTFQDGVVSNPSSMVRELQRWANRQSDL